MGRGGDYAFHTMLLGKIAPERLGELAEAVQAGHALVKMFTTDIVACRRGRMVDFGDIWEVLKVLAQAGGIAAIHAEDNDIVMHIAGAALYMMHTSAKTGVDAIAAARAKGVPIYGETLHQYLMYTAEDYRRPNGQIRAAELHEADYTPWEGRDLASWPSLVMLRGKIVVENGAFSCDLSDGQFLSRKVPEEVRSRPAV
jgi:dihydroorotase-like cyclic amidohydrolase